MVREQRSHMPRGMKKKFLTFVVQESEKIIYRVGENTCKSYPDKGLVPTFYKLHLNNKKTTQLCNAWALLLGM